MGSRSNISSSMVGLDSNSMMRRVNSNSSRVSLNSNSSISKHQQQRGRY